jgi:hypothetical protein
LRLLHQQLVLAALAAAQPPEAVSQNASLEEGFELVFNESRQLDASADLGVSDEAGCMLLHWSMQRGLLVVNRGAIGRPLGPPADGLHDGLPVR